ncbi:hypothetical protein DFH05DRAFT_1500307 [Lentinula detonsa]|uniref:DUF6534 domain-containing protein n=1 Tax=Lentinula detonsa TaxID=2804962 RepID=A0A9W8NWT1_9AGAR|nr:hypothetical protein DFH05DRAFT_1500307 [Lentinula detonsa]
MTSPMSLPLPMIPPNIAQLTGPLIFGGLMNAFLFGVLTCQVYMYHASFPLDAKYIKCLVYAVYIIDLSATAMVTADMYHWFGVGFGNMLFVNDVYLSAFDTPMCGAILASIVQCFYCYRLLKLNHRTTPICALVILIALATVTAGVYGAIVGHIAKTFSAAASKTLPAVYIVYVGSAVADVLIAATMTTLLLFSSQSHQRSHYIIKRIINLTVETNAASSFLAILTVILLVAVPNTNSFTCPSMFLGKIYSNSLLLLLNNRNFLIGGSLHIPSSNASSTVNPVQRPVYYLNKPSPHAGNTESIALDHLDSSASTSTIQKAMETV